MLLVTCCSPVNNDTYRNDSTSTNMQTDMHTCILNENKLVDCGTCPRWHHVVALIHNNTMVGTNKTHFRTLHGSVL